MHFLSFLKSAHFQSKHVLLAAALCCGAGMTAVAQTPTFTPRLQVYGGYSFLYPNATASGVRPGGVLPVASCLCANPAGFGGGATFGFTPWLGLTVDGSKSLGGGGSTPAQQVGQWNSYTVVAGPTLRYPGHRVSPFLEGLVGVDRLNPSLFPPGNSSLGVVAGGGLDVLVGKHFGLRPVRVDYVFSDHSYGVAPNGVTANENGLRVQGGILVVFGNAGHRAPRPLPVVAQVVTPIAPAVVSVAAPLPEQTTLTLAATPAAVVAGESSTINAAGFSLQARPLTYSYEASAGTILGNGNVATLSTAGLAAGTILVTGTVIDNFGGRAVATTNVAVTQPVAAARVAVALGAIDFARYANRPTRVNNESKAALDAVALSLNREAGGTLVVIGSAAAGEPRGERLAAQRAVNTKAYLVQEKGVDAARIAVYTGPAGEKSVTITLLPAGVALDRSDLTPVDERVVRAVPR